MCQDEGLLAGIEIVTDRKLQTPADKQIMKRLFDGTVAAGVMIRTMENAVILSPPLMLEASHVDHILNALDAGLSRM